MRRLAGVFIVMAMLLSARAALAHANLDHANPPANATLMQPPEEIRLSFTEPLEPNFSGITLLNANGETVDTAAAILDPADPHQLVLRPGDLPDGLYTVSWRALSSADGHATQGNYAFTIGAASRNAESAPGALETIPDFSITIRWLNFAGMSLALGSIGFWLFVWNPCGFGSMPNAEKRMSRLIWLGWLLLGVSGIAMLLLQLSNATGTPLLQPHSLSALEDFLNNTRFGTLWWGRMTLWFAMGNALVFASDNRRILWIAFGLGLGVLLTNSLFSHASTAPDQAAAVAGDWLHLTMTALWVGGLVQFLNVIGLARRATSEEVSASSTLVAHFSNYARVAVAGLAITGLYAAWLQVGTLEALATTLYGQALLVKITLFVPLLVIAGINLVYTNRRLREGDIVWARRLRGLVGAEITLLLGMLVAVGVMTSVNPARAVLAVRNAVPPAPPPYFQMQIADDVMVHLSISPGTVGTNTFSLDLYTTDGDHVTDASSARLRFQSNDSYQGESALVLEAQPDGTYQAVGDNLSLPGNWRVRANIQRPDAYDTVVDFAPEIAAPPPPPDLAAQAAPPLSQRPLALLATGALALVMGGFFVGTSRAPLWRGMGLLATSVILVGMVFLVSGVMVG